MCDVTSQLQFSVFTVWVTVGNIIMTVKVNVLVHTSANIYLDLLKENKQSVFCDNNILKTMYNT